MYLTRIAHPKTLEIYHPPEAESQHTCTHTHTMDANALSMGTEKVLPASIHSLAADVFVFLLFSFPFPSRLNRPFPFALLRICSVFAQPKSLILPRQ